MLSHTKTRALQPCHLFHLSQSPHGVWSRRRDPQTMHNCPVYIMHARELIQCSLVSYIAPRVRNRSFFVDAVRGELHVVARASVEATVGAGPCKALCCTDIFKQGTSSSQALTRIRGDLPMRQQEHTYECVLIRPSTPCFLVFTS